MLNLIDIHVYIWIICKNLTQRCPRLEPAVAGGARVQRWIVLELFAV